MNEHEEFGGTGMWLFALLILFFFGNGNFGGNAQRGATVEDLNTTSNFTRMENAIQLNGQLTERKTDAIINGISTLGYELSQGQNNATNTLSAQINALSSKIDQNKIEELQAQVSELKTQNMFCGVPKINPYGYGVYPYNCGNV